MRRRLISGLNFASWMQSTFLLLNKKNVIKSSVGKQFIHIISYKIFSKDTYTYIYIYIDYIYVIFVYIIVIF